MGKFKQQLRKATTVKPLSIVFQGDGKKYNTYGKTIGTGNPLKIIDKNNLMITITPC
jgi:hypothetical protein